MRNGTLYAKRIRRLFLQLCRQHGKPNTNELTDPTEQLILMIMYRETSDVKARAALERLRRAMVDYNELRVTAVPELAALLGADLPAATRKAGDLTSALNKVYERQHGLQMTFLRDMPRREAREYLESLPGVDRARAAGVVLYSLGGHAIPVDEETLQVLRKEGLVDQRASIEAVEGFLERNVSSADAAAFTTLMRRYVATKAHRPGPSTTNPASKPAGSKRATTRRAVPKSTTSTARRSKAGASRSRTPKRRASSPARARPARRAKSGASHASSRRASRRK